MEQQNLLESPDSVTLASQAAPDYASEIESLKNERIAADERTAALEQKLEKLSAPQKPAPVGDDLSTNLILNPQQVFDRNNQIAADLAVAQMRKETSQAETLNQVLTSYPKLKDKADPFTGRVAVEYQRRLERAGIASGSHDADILRDSAMLVEREDLIAKQNAIDDGTYVPSPITESGVNSLAAPRVSRSIVSDVQRGVAQALGLTEAQTVNAYTNRKWQEAA